MCVCVCACVRACVRACVCVSLVVYDCMLKVYVLLYCLTFSGIIFDFVSLMTILPVHYYIGFRLLCHVLAVGVFKCQVLYGTGFRLHAFASGGVSRLRVLYDVTTLDFGLDLLDVHAPTAENVKTLCSS